MTAIDAVTIAKLETPTFLDRLWRRPGAYIALWFLIILYGSLPFVELIAPYAPEPRNNEALFAPPSDVHWFHDGAFVGPYIYGSTSTVDLQTFQRTYSEDKTKTEKLRFLCEGDAYRFWDLFESRLHFFCPADQ